MKKLFFVVAVVIILSFIGCGVRGASGNMQKLPAEDGATEISIAVVDLGNFYHDAAKGFEEKTGVKVNVINYYNAETGGDDHIVAKSKAEMLAGKGADLYAYDSFDFKQLGGKGLICKLENWVPQDPFFSEDKLYMNIINASLKNNAFALPLSFTVDKLEATAPVPEMEGLGKLTWEQFFDKEKDFKRSGRLLGMYDFEVFEQRFRAKAQFFIDENKKTQQLDSQEMVSLLKQCKKWADQNLCISSTVQNGYYEYALFEAPQVLEGDIYLLNNITDNVIYPFDMPSDYSDSRIDNQASAKDFVAINAASKYQKTAWEFIKFLMDFKVQSSQEMLYIPVNRAAMDMQTEYVLNVMQRDGIINNPSKEKDEIMDKIESIQKVYSLDRCTTIVLNEACRYFIGETSAEKAAKDMATKVQLYLMEQ